MKVVPNTVVTVQYRLSDLKGPQGRSIPPESGELVYLHGGYQGTLPRVEEALSGLSVGGKIDLVLEPADHFGEYQQILVRTEPKSAVPAEVKVGMVLEGIDPATQHPVLFHVLKIDEETVTLDGNHPLAGQTIRFTAEITDIREATAEEIAHGHAHGPGGHHHH